MPGSSDPPETKTLEAVQAPVVLAPGTQIGAYVLGQKLASGGFGAVYRATHAKLGRPVAIKILHAGWSASPEQVRRFEREAQVVNRIRHSGIIDISDIAETEDGRPYFVMELLSGADLRAEIKAHGRLSPQVSRTILLPVCEALEAAHQHGVIHRDVKASNIFLARNGSERRVVLLDFGIAKLLDATAITNSAAALGTPSCMAPEQITNGAIDARTDVYALGVLLYHMLTGELPFPDAAAASMQYLHLHAKRPRVSSKIEIPSALDDLVVHAMAIDPEARIPSAAAFAAALERAF